jgi:hypothetical protein
MGSCTAFAIASERSRLASASPMRAARHYRLRLYEQRRRAHREKIFSRDIVILDEGPMVRGDLAMLTRDSKSGVESEDGNAATERAGVLDPS